MPRHCPGQTRQLEEPWQDPQSVQRGLAMVAFTHAAQVCDTASVIKTIITLTRSDIWRNCCHMLSVQCLRLEDLVWSGGLVLGPSPLQECRVQNLWQGDCLKTSSHTSVGREFWIMTLSQQLLYCYEIYFDSHSEPFPETRENIFESSVAPLSRWVRQNEQSFQINSMICNFNMFMWLTWKHGAFWYVRLKPDHHSDSTCFCETAVPTSPRVFLWVWGLIDDCFNSL